MSLARPIISGVYADPSICRAGDTYYIVNSSFEFLPGLPLHSSVDLVTWTPVGNALTRRSQIAENAGLANTGIFAPTIRHHDGRFWIIGTNMLDLGTGRGHFIISAEDPAGPWSDPVFMKGVLGIDPDLAWDEDGVAHVTWASVRPHGIISAPVDLRTGEALAEPKFLWQGSGGAHPEGPHLYRKDGWWYLLLAEGGTERGHMVTIARARSLDDEFEPAPENPILSHRSSSEPVQNVGHADLIELADGSWAAVHLGVRPRGQTPLFHVNGRETFIVGIDWTDGWPTVDEDRFAVPEVDHSFVDRFDAELDARWIGAGSFPSSFTRKRDSGGVIIDADNPSPGQAVLAVRARDDAWSSTVTVDAAGGAGRFALRIDPRHWYGIDFDSSSVTATLAIGPAVSTIGTVSLAAGSVVTLRISAKPGVGNAYFGSDEPDLVELAVVGENGEDHVFGAFDGRYLSTEVSGGFTGRLIGVEALRGSVELLEFRYVSSETGSAND